MRIVLVFLLLLSNIIIVNLSAQEVPLIYDVENSGADCPAPPLPAFADLAAVNPLTDPFEWSDGSGRDTTLDGWRCRRTEIGAEIQHYEIGERPGSPDTIMANYYGGVLTVIIIVNDDTLTLTSEITLPAGNGPFPAIIGMGGGSGALPADIFTSRNIALVPFNFSQVMAWEQVRGSEPINRLYPELAYIGANSGWSWGVSRLIDGLELVQADLPIDLKHLAVSGCSFAGKMALFAGAFDERIALTIAQESGGGGAATWRVLETLSGVEKLSATSHLWFSEDLFLFSNAVSKLPYDHHELMAMVAPRALLVLGNPPWVWLGEEAGYVSCRAAHEVWKKFGVPDRFGFSHVGGHTHCELAAAQRTAVEAFVDKFMLGDTTVNTNITEHTYPYVDYSRWYEWWGTGNPVFPDRNTGQYQISFYEPECAIIGKNWKKSKYGGCSNGYYVVVRSDTQSVATAPTSINDQISITFAADKDTTYHIFGRVNCPTENDDSYWIKIDDGSFTLVSGLVTTVWDWLHFTEYELTAGEHTLIIAYCENGALLDKICISNCIYAPEGMGANAENLCNVTGELDLPGMPAGYTLAQNYPNPFNPVTEISYSLPVKGFVILKIYDALGREILILVNEEKPAGRYKIKFNAAGFGSGIYFCQLKVGMFTERRKMVLIK